MAVEILSESALRAEAMRILIAALSAVDAKRFITNIKNDHFDYTDWQRNLWKDKTIEELHKDAEEFYNKRHQ